MAAIATVALSRLDTLLLRAALLDGDAARAAYAELNRAFDLDAVDYGRQRLLPLLHRNLTGLGIDDPRLGRLRGIRHYHWAKNQVRVRAVAPVLAALRAAGVRAALLKGAALIAGGLADMSLRPMDDIDILVPHGQRDAAIGILAAHGFHPKEMPAWYVRGEVPSHFAGWQFADAAGFEIDLHWFLLHLDRRPGADDGVWRRAVSTTFAGQEIAVLAPADQVFHALAHAAGWSDTSLLRWAADVALTLRGAGPSMDWAPLIEEAGNRRMAPPLHDGLAALRAAVGVDVPDGVTAALARLGSRMSRFEHELRAETVARRSPRKRRWLGLFDARRLSAATMRRPLAAAVIPYLRAQLGGRSDAPPPGLLLHALLGRPAWLRRALGIGRWARNPAPDGLPELATGYAPELAASRRGACLEGWSTPETEGRWAVTFEAHLAWRLPDAAPAAIDCEIEATPFWPPGVRPARVDVWVNEHHAARWRPGRVAGDDKGLRFRIPSAAVAGRRALVMSFAIARLHTPAEHGLSIDARPLGFFLRGIRFSPVTG